MSSKQLVHLRPIAVSDAAHLFEFWSDPDVTAFMNISPMQRVEQAEEMIAYITQLNNANRYTIVLNEHTIIGTCGFNYIDPANQRGEIGYELGKKYWRNGYMNQALQTLLQKGFFQLDLNRIEAKVEPGNRASRMLLEKIGFQQEGTLRQYEKLDGVFLDMVFYSLLQTDYTAI
ncbi:ribosomal-protein-alanine N-acetyltransferase [Terribacillus aidingensis]|uniref:Ribosomal-protein-alanine N-acetyltransferase n=1 Tax=Terribacillus aidingensis TaxID=586416 RepID=A0A285MZP5_9BACI|nr:GNAT family protein [Terribacillus aidingensis]SNZ02662.1 ribosomal-protein-alanine N-acetyltransferase [Terribacillus aidingensis]